MESERRWARALTSEDLGRFLADVRVERGRTQQELADDLGITRRYLYEIESGKPSLYTERLFALLRTLGVRLVLEAEVRPSEWPMPTDGPRSRDTTAGEGVP